MDFDIRYILALHIIFVVTWFAGLFYIVRLFIYHSEAQEKEEPERSILQKQYKLMEKRLWYIITWPSMVLVVITGFWLLFYFNYWLRPFMHMKLAFVLLLILYHLACHRIFNQLQRDEVKHKSFKLRLWNEVATILLFAIVFIIVLKDAFSFLWGIAGLLAFGGILFAAVKFYKRARERK